ncbi:PLP-dependent aminotransferase family protein [Sulfitobacter mediterraneus]|uniref:DNA-binding transcriptional MocR family regulator n=1 Tax=Sulfitobacter mediterraneus TaxID=83219 RepID=A0A2T6CHC1_9RHOB|nr:PLP-dependent aminotransferase family protein [Sulfitobacter mediterraneus]KIN77217.1 Transcriptional regulator, GntR family protein [Sulfitobacter mediterraneus KCTC 32188]PTX74893.1 DNA-binding transcriptional MocR family regulator [Sulfitobacter mediterraneus]
MGTIWSPEVLQGPGPKYKAVVDAIRAQIVSGTMPEGTKLPPVRELAWQLKITPGTVARAYTILTDDGTLRAEVGRGTFVAAPRQGEAPLGPIEVDVVRHNTPETNGYVNLYSPHLPTVGQAGLIRKLLAEIAADPPSGVMHYPTRNSSEPARAAMAEWLKGTPIGPVDARDVVLSHGGQSAIMLILQTILRGRRPVVFIEELAYPGFRRTAELLRAEVVPIAMDKDGVIPEALAAAAARHPEGQVFCTSPEVHSPTCSFTPMSRRRALVEVCRAHDLQIMEDDCYRMGRAEGAGYRQLAPERGWYLSSLSKSITPALRVGCAVAPRGMENALHRTAEHSYFGLATPITDLVAKLLVHPALPPIADAVLQVLGHYVQTAVNVLGGYDLQWREDVPFLWLSLPQGWRATAFCQAAEKQGVQIRAAEEFACRDAHSPHAVRISINAGIDLETFEAAMVRLVGLLDNPPEQIGV